MFEKYSKDRQEEHLKLFHMPTNSDFGKDLPEHYGTLTYYDEEMEQCAEEYAQYCFSVVENVKKVCKDPVVLIEQKLDFSKYVPEGFGTGDCVIIGDGTLYVIDYKHGKGVEVQADNNSHMHLVL